MTYVNTVANHKIWKISREIQFGECVFSVRKVITSIIKTFEARRRVEESNWLRHCKKIEKINILIDAAKIASSSTLLNSQFGVR